jgi:hypothetical protein
MLGQEEKNIPTNPAAKTSALLKEVFGKCWRDAANKVRCHLLIFH